MIQFVDLKKEYESLNAEINQKIKMVLRKGLYILDEEARKFEDEFSKYIGTKHAISVNSGSDALFFAIRSLKIGKDDEVITVPHSFISTADAISRNGAIPIFVDIEPHTYCMDVSKLEERLTKKTKAVLPVHLYGHPADMDPIYEFTEENELFLVEDACQAHGAEYKGVKVGGIGDVGCFSFYPTKNLGAYGDGGILLTNNDGIAENLRQLRNYGQTKKYHYDFVGFNSRLDEIQASILRIKLKYLNDWNERRRYIAKLYDQLLQDSSVILPVEKENSKHVYHLYVIRSKNRDVLKRELFDNEIQTEIHYPIPIYKQKAYSDFSNHLPVTDKICSEILSLPNHPWLSDDEIIRVTEMINALC